MVPSPLGASVPPVKSAWNGPPRLSPSPSPSSSTACSRSSPTPRLVGTTRASPAANAPVPGTRRVTSVYLVVPIIASALAPIDVKAGMVLVKDNKAQVSTKITGTLLTPTDSTATSISTPANMKVGMVLVKDNEAPTSVRTTKALLTSTSTTMALPSDTSTKTPMAQGTTLAISLLA
ncbi:flocculation protein FLO11-like [Juglans microcarpa x Juglans regia]|uniref:flocculation protein FLO11-like n=1 Tax=Juglans microcarpa x Juglans regia TaxID=2249226 RepID=UPI001B7F76C0|nr:flocculation protein FLO11-like [Juglans microcarpa x Juglans regia]